MVARASNSVAVVLPPEFQKPSVKGKNTFLSNIGASAQREKHKMSCANYKLHGKKMMCREQSKASKYYPYRWNLPFLCELERPFPVCKVKTNERIDDILRGGMRTSKDLAIVVYDPAAYMVCTRTSQHARRGLFGVKVLGVRFSLRVRAIRPQHLLHFVH